MKYLLIQDNEVKNIVVASPESIDDLFPDYEVSPLDPENPIQIGSTFNGTEWIAPAPPEPLPAPVVPDWNAFNAAILSDVDFNVVYATVNTTHPLLASSLPTALSQVASNGVEAFALVFNAFIGVSNATAEQRVSWAALAEANNLPADFVDVLLPPLAEPEPN